MDKTRVTEAGWSAEGDRQPIRPKIVCLCGSTRFYQAFQQANYEETMAGRIVLSVGFYPHAAKEVHGEGVGATSEQKEALDALHFRKIELADEVLVLNVGGYVGDSTRREVRHAYTLDKPVRWLESEMIPEDLRPAGPNIEGVFNELAAKGLKSWQAITSSAPESIATLEEAQAWSRRNGGAAFTDGHQYPRLYRDCGNDKYPSLQCYVKHGRVGNWCRIETGFELLPPFRPRRPEPTKEEPQPYTDDGLWSALPEAKNVPEAVRMALNELSEDHFTYNALSPTRLLCVARAIHDWAVEDANRAMLACVRDAIKAQDKRLEQVARQAVHEELDRVWRGIVREEIAATDVEQARGIDEKGQTNWCVETERRLKPRSES
jgi:hypothetical protein